MNMLSESQWFATYSPPSWLSQFEGLAVDVVGPDSFARTDAERLLKRWVDTRVSSCKDLLQVVRTTRNTSALIVALLLCRSSVFKLWGRSVEEVRLADNLRASEANGGAPGTVNLAKVAAQEQPVDNAVIEEILELTRGLIETGLSRWPGDFSADAKASRNHIFTLVSLLLKKGWSISASTTEARFYPLVKELLNMSLRVFSSAFKQFAGPAGLKSGEGNTVLCHSDVVAQQLLAELTRAMSASDLGAIGISWEDYMDSKRLYELHILQNLVPELLLFMQKMLYQAQVYHTALMATANAPQSPQRESEVPFLCHFLAEREDGAVILRIMEQGLVFLERFVDWEFSYTRSQALLPCDIWFLPSDGWYSVLFEVPLTDSCQDTESNSVAGAGDRLFSLKTTVMEDSRVMDEGPLSGVRAGSRMTNFFEIMIRFYRSLRKDFVFYGQKGQEAMVASIRILLDQMRYILCRSILFRPTRMMNRFALPTMPAAAAGGGAARRVAQLNHLTRIVYAPFASALVDLIETGLFVDQFDRLFGSDSKMHLVGLRQIAADELQSLCHTLARLVDNADMHMPALLAYTPCADKQIQVLQWCFGRLLALMLQPSALMALGDVQDSVSHSIEYLGFFFGQIAMFSTGVDMRQRPAESAVTTGSEILGASVQPDGVLMTKWYPTFSQAAEVLSSQLLQNRLRFFSAQEDQDDGDNGFLSRGALDARVQVEDADDDAFYVYHDIRETIPAIESQFIHDSLKGLAAFGRCNSAHTASMLADILEAGFNHIRSSRTQQDQTDIGALYDELLWVLGYTFFFLVEPEDRRLDSRQPPVIPRPFILQEQAGAPCSAAIDRLFSIVTTSLEIATSDPAFVPPSLIETLVCVLERFIGCYWLRGAQSGMSCIKLCKYGYRSEEVNVIAELLNKLLALFSHELTVCRLAVRCYLRLASPLSPTVIFFWDTNAVKQLISEIKTLAEDPGASRLMSWRSNELSHLCQALASSTCTSEYIKDIVEAQQSLDSTFPRSTTLFTLNLTEARFQRLVDGICSVHGALMNLGHALQHGGEAADPSRAVWLSHLFSVMEGVLRGASDHKPALREWMRPLIAEIVPSLGRGYALYPQVLRTLVKYVYWYGKSLLSTLPKDMTREYYLAIETLTICFSRCYTSESMSNDNSALEEATVEELTDDVAFLCKLLSFLLGQMARTSTSGSLFTGEADDTNQSQEVSQDKVWSANLVMSTFSVLYPLLLRRGNPDDPRVCLALEELLFQLFEDYSEVVFSNISKDTAVTYFEAIGKGLFSSTQRCQTAASEALGACIQYIIKQQRRAKIYSFKLDLPPGECDVFSVTPASAPDVLAVFEHEIAQTGLRLLLNAVTAQHTLKDSSFYSYVLYDVFSLLAMKLYNLKHFFDRFEQLICHDSPAMDKSAAQTAFRKAAEPVVVHFSNWSKQAQEIIDLGQSDSIQQIRYTQLRTQFRQLYETLILGCRVASNIKKSRV